MRNVTITLDDETADWARVWSATHQTSVSRMLGDLLAQKMRLEERYSASMNAYLSVQPMALAEPGARYPHRDEAHER
ncbi:MAG: CopG family transcriptional regulator [Betaproteobacteria bacterium]|nr:CopG family transcriptional regulator [Betaproteobacteria bacterium]